VEKVYAKDFYPQVGKSAKECGGELAKFLEGKDDVCVDLNGVLGYPTSFLTKAFGGYVGEIEFQCEMRSECIRAYEAVKDSKEALRSIVRRVLRKIRKMYLMDRRVSFIPLYFKEFSSEESDILGALMYLTQEGYLWCRASYEGYDVAFDSSVNRRDAIEKLIPSAMVDPNDDESSITFTFYINEEWAKSLLGGGQIVTTANKRHNARKKKVTFFLLMATANKRHNARKKKMIIFFLLMALVALALNTVQTCHI